MSVKVGNQEFKNQQLVLGEVHKIVEHYAIGSTVSDPKERQFLCDLLQNHPEASSKIGCGIGGFRVVINEHGGKAFNLIRVDGSETDFSYMKCIKGKPSTSLQNFKMACRRAIADYVNEYKNCYFAVYGQGNLAPCELTGKMLPKENMVVHHEEPSFDAIVMSFIDKNHINLATVKYIKGIDNHTGVEFKDVGMAKAFLQYHTNICFLQCIDKGMHKPSLLKQKSG